jgi:hypothetical protein
MALFQTDRDADMLIATALPGDQWRGLSNQPYHGARRPGSALVDLSSHTAAAGRHRRRAVVGVEKRFKSSRLGFCRLASLYAIDRPIAHSTEWSCSFPPVAVGVDGGHADACQVSE